MTKHVVLRAGNGLPVSSAFFGPVLMDALAALQDRLDRIVDDGKAIIAAADEEGRDLTDEEVAQIEAGDEAGKKIKAQIEARQKMTQQGQGRRTSPEATATGTLENNGRRTIPATPRVHDARGGFQSFGEFAKSVYGAARNPGNADQRLQNAATTYGNEGTGADGGFAVPPEFRRTIWQKVMDDENLLTRCERMETSSNNMVVPKDETTPWQSSGGIQCYWEGEAAAATQSKPQLTMETLRLNKLMAIVPISEETLSDAPGLESWLRAKAPSKMRSKVNTAIVRGTGVGQPLGILTSPSLITVSQEQSQAAASVLFDNINKMWNRLYGPCRRNAVWLINQDIEPQLDVMEFSPGSTVPIPVYLPPGGVSDRPYATLKGRPVIPVEACSTLGTVGDIILVDLMQYTALTKAGQDIRTDVSMHLYFDQAMEAFRFIFRVTGQPSWGSSISPENGSTTRSWAVALETRAG